MGRKSISIKGLVLIILSFCLFGCSKNVVNADLSQEENEIQIDSSSKEPEEVQAEDIHILDEIPIEFPFGDEEEYELSLVTDTDSSGEYELHLRDKAGEVLQQIPCGQLTEPIEFSFDGISYGSWNDLEIFSSGSENGLLFIWENGLFSENPIEIPRYEENRGSAMLTVTEDENLCEKQIYLLNVAKGKTEKVRNFKLQKETGMLEIWDELENQSLFEGTVRLNEEQNPVNEEYIDMFLWSDIGLFFDDQEENVAHTPLYVWIGEETVKEEAAEEHEQNGETSISSFEDVQNVLFGNPGHTQEYESREALLEDFGFENSEPMYQYFDRYGNLQLELFADDSLENVCGISYSYQYNSELEKVVSMYGFTLCEVMDTEWNGQDPFELKTAFGEAISDCADYVEDYEESIQYTNDGKTDCFLSMGKIDDGPEADQPQRIVEINYIYREDGTLFCREYSHNSLIFGTTFCSMDSFYDENSRVIFESGYITHGHVEYYYIYEDKDGEPASKPTYILYIDYNLNYAIPSMVRCQ